MRVLHVVDSLKFGGIESFVLYLVKSQLKNPILDIGVLFCEEYGALRSEFLNTGVKCYFFDLRPFDLSKKKYDAICDIAMNYEIVHIHSFKPIRDFFLRKQNCKLIFTQHSVYGWGRITKRTDGIKRIILKRFMNKYYDAITYNSRYTKAFWEKEGIHNKNSAVIYNGVFFDRAISPPEDLDKDFFKNKFVIGTSSRFIEWKRVDYLVNAFSKFQKNKESVVLLLVGDGYERQKLEKLVDDLDIRSKTIFTGFSSHVSFYQSLMDVCVFPSTTETFGLVAVECLYLGKAVLVMKDGGGITEIIERVEEQDICEDIDKLVSRMDYYYSIKDDSDTNKRLHELRRACAESFDMDEAEKSFCSIYKMNV